jgi:von Willebrand factor type A domain-containing protein
MTETIAVVVAVSVFALAIAIYALTARNRSAIAEATGEPAERWRMLKNALRFMAGPLPISVTIHVLILLFLLWGVHVEAGRNLISVNFQSAGGGGSHGSGDELKELKMPEMPMPEMAAPMPITRPVMATSGTEAVAAATHYVRSIAGGGEGVGRGGGIGSGYGEGIGAGFGGFIGGLRKSGLDVVLVIDGTGSMNLIIDDVKDRMKQLVLAIHRLVPTARIGIVVFGGRGEPIDTVALTVNPTQLIMFLSTIRAHDGGEWQEDTLGAVRTAVGRMAWRPEAKKVIVLVGDTPPFDEDNEPVMQSIAQFRAENGTFNTVDVTVEEHQRFIAQWAKSEGVVEATDTGLPDFYLQTQHAYKAMAAAGGGTWRSLTKDQQINQQVLILAFGSQWQTEVASFGRVISSSHEP